MKYHNQRVIVDGITFDSKKEANRWAELKLMEKAGLIRDLKRQVPFVLIPTQRDEKGKVIEREVRYIADFVYREKGKLSRTVEDVKSPATKTAVYKIKKKLMLYRLGIIIKEV